MVDSGFSALLSRDRGGIDVQVMLKKSELAFPPSTHYPESPADTQQGYNAGGRNTQDLL
jgi:hypothetical protein